MRLTIGKVSAWTILQAHQQARDYQVMVDKGFYPRQVKADKEATKLIEAAEKEKKERLESITVGGAWDEYVEERKAFGQHHTIVTMLYLCKLAVKNEREVIKNLLSQEFLPCLFPSDW